MTSDAQTYSAHTKAILKLGFPLVASNLAQFAIHITDTVMLGRYDVTTLAPVTLASTAFFVTFIVGAGFAMAVTPLVAEAAENDDTTQARRVTRMGLWWSVIYGAVFIVPFFWAEKILIAIGQDAVVAAMAHDYLIIACFGLIPALLVMTFKSYLAALEHTAIILWGTVGAAIINVFVNYALIFGNWGAPELGIQGAAIASVVTQCLSVAILLVYALRVLPQYQLLKNIWKSDWPVFGQVVRLGWPIGLTSLAESGLFAASAFLMGLIGALELAAHGIAIQLAGLTFMVHIGLSQAATVRAGRALGRKDEAHLRRGATTVTLISVCYSMCTMAAFLLFPEILISFFVSPDEVLKDELIEIGVVLLALAALFQLVDGAQVIALGLLRGVQDTAIPMVMATLSYWVLAIPISYVLAFNLGLNEVGLWLGLVCGLSFAAILLMWRFWSKSVRIS